MILKQYYLGCLSQASYLVADETTNVAAIIDPRRDTYEYLEHARDLGVRIEHVILTHFHADFIAGHLELHELTGATIHLGSRASADFPFSPLSDGAEIDLGGVRLRCLETPGHTPESICLLVLDRGAEEPHAVLTGDTLFIGDVGRPDLMASIGFTAEELAGNLFDSLREKLLPLPDATLLYPGHGAGSMCGKNLSTDTVSTIGDQRRLNYALQPMNREDFIHLVTADQPTAPAYFAHDAIMNRQRRRTLDQILEQAMTPVALDQAQALARDGAQLLDVRSADAFAGGHLPGSINIGLRGDYAVWAGTVLHEKRPIVILADPGDETEAATRLGRIGFDHIAGYLDRGIDGLGTTVSLDSYNRLTPDTLAETMTRTDPPLILDIRSPREREQGSIDGSLHVPLNNLLAAAGTIPADRAIVTVCAGGYRSSIASSLLLAQGRRNVVDLAGGMNAWETAGRPVATPQTAG